MSNHSNAPTAGRLTIVEGGLDAPRVAALLARHLAECRAQTPPESSHALDLSGLRGRDIRFWTAWDGDALLGCGALRLLNAEAGEVKSMHTAEAARGRGVGRAILRHVVDVARARGLRTLSLETGAQPYFGPARALYAAHGFVPCGPFADYGPDPNSVFMTRRLGPLPERAAADGDRSAPGHNGGPPLEEPSTGMAEWRAYCWRRAHRRAWRTPPREIALRRLARAEALGMTYRAYALEIMERGRFL